MAAESGSNHFHFSVDAVDPKLLFRLSQELGRQPQSFSWIAHVRADPGFLVPGVIDSLAEAGCSGLYIGVESIVQRVQDCMNKGTSAGVAHEICERLTEAGIPAFAGAFIGYPSETPAEAVETQQWTESLSERVPLWPPWVFILSEGQTVLKMAREGKTEGLVQMSEDESTSNAVDLDLDLSTIPEMGHGQLRYAFEKQGMTWTQSAQQQRIGQVNWGCNPRIVWSLFGVLGPVYLQYYLTHYSMSELTQRWSRLDDPVLLAERIGLLFPTLLRHLAPLSGKPSDHLLQPPALQPVIDEYYEEHESPQTKMETLDYLHYVLKAFLKRQKELSQDLTALLEVARFEFLKNRAFLRDNDRIPEVSEEDEGFVEQFQIDVKSLISANSLTTLKIGDVCKVSFDVRGVRVL